MNVANGVYFAVSAAQRERIRKQQRVEMERQMREIAQQENAPVEAIAAAGKLTESVLKGKEHDDERVETTETDEVLVEEELE